ncbi:ATP/GTP-binding protein [Arthrobacter sp. H35-D1]|uniref:ATP/GTP-binding protein n=1 Tax=Arthrobacter sp. H35-D1 TaxID=3046202 RepID=UPI0024B8F5EA|nr:ATP/GTP-binding protein [Arthrobacter sp. H35-D1]MDJ0313078.1 ATP/GTP-binding protein [Arthrobacter sp. H35-D1]
MPRSNRPRRSPGSPARSSKWTKGAQRNDDDGEDLNRTRLGVPATEAAPDGVWAVRSISAGNAQKAYTCPGCNHPVMPGVAHLVVWQEDALFGAEAGLRERRHWHSNCWRGRSYRYR